MSVLSVCQTFVFLVNLQLSALTIPVDEVQSLRSLSPKKEKVPAIEIHFGIPSHVNTITIYLKQVQNLK